MILADLSPVVGSEQEDSDRCYCPKRHRQQVQPQYSLAITSQIMKARLPTHVELPATLSGLDKDSVVLLEQVRTIDKRRLKRRITKLDDDIMAKVDEALAISCGLRPI